MVFWFFFFKEREGGEVRMRAYGESGDAMGHRGAGEAVPPQHQTGTGWQGRFASETTNFRAVASREASRGFLRRQKDLGDVDEI